MLGFVELTHGDGVHGSAGLAFRRRVPVSDAGRPHHPCLWVFPVRCYGFYHAHAWGELDRMAMSVWNQQTRWARRGAPCFGSYALRTHISCCVAFWMMVATGERLGAINWKKWLISCVHLHAPCRYHSQRLCGCRDVGRGCAAPRSLRTVSSGLSSVCFLYGDGWVVSCGASFLTCERVTGFICESEQRCLFKELSTFTATKVEIHLRYNPSQCLLISQDGKTKIIVNDYSIALFSQFQSSQILKK